MKKKGTIIKFDNYNGIILSEDNIEYLFNKNNLLYDAKINDKVIFNSELFETVEIKKYVATFIEKA